MGKLPHRKEEVMTGRHINTKRTGLALLFGGLAGAGAALMFAPLSGRQTRQRLSDFAEDTKCKAETYGRMAKGRVTSAMQKGKGLLKRKNLG